ncbi:unnamed protein product [Mycena citricolor]|uniref:Muskelin N-terminal domain-containing protein n=1 Tax=Mycena citricolor TaxID=2018698 RepID=A0AAD2HUE8_9AGAR|nr:unnamed protein product [Mycena citricolor]
MAATSVPLRYTVTSSPHSGPYRPEYITVDNPPDQSSRWSGGPIPETGSPPWLLIRLDSLAVVQTITFGKYSNVHPCNMKDFKVFAGPAEDALSEVLHAQLKNDTQAETLSVKHTNAQGITIPFRFVKIMPLSSHGSSFHISVWHVALHGIKDEVYVEEKRLKFEQHRETMAMRHVLKYLRQHRFFTQYDAILARCGLQAEDPLVTELHKSIVLQGNWAAAEEVIERLSHTELFDKYRNARPCRPVWRRLLGQNADGDVPSPRGGHAMCIDSNGGVVYLLGGWNGVKSLDDFWAYNIKEDKWRVLSYQTSAERDAPSARSCHKMVFDSKTGHIYVLGRLDDADAGKLEFNNYESNLMSADMAFSKVGCEFYRYHTRGSMAGRWESLSREPQSAQSPPLVYDHQMVIDCESQIIYAYGGRVLDGEWTNPKFAGLYSYNIRQSKWSHLQASPKPSAPFSGGIIPSRIGHSMVLDDRTRKLYIFGGRTTESARYDMYSYDIATQTTRQLSADVQREHKFNATFASRAVIDPQLQEIYVFSGWAPDEPVRMPALGTRIYRYRSGIWDVMLPASGQEEPVARFANQLVYCTRSRTFFMHGGNAGVPDTDEMDDGKSRRLDDFWQMTLLRAPREEIVRLATLKIRQQQFREMCQDSSQIKALNFLRSSILPLVNQDDPAEAELYRGLMAFMFTPSSPARSSHPNPTSGAEHEDSPPKKRSRPNTPEDTEMTSVDSPIARIPFEAQAIKQTEDPGETKGVSTVSKSRFEQRNGLFEALLEFIGDDAKQPSASLVSVLDKDLAVYS